MRIFFSELGKSYPGFFSPNIIIMNMNMNINYFAVKKYYGQDRSDHSGYYNPVLGYNLVCFC